MQMISGRMSIRALVQFPECRHKMTMMDPGFENVWKWRKWQEQDTEGRDLA